MSRVTLIQCTALDPATRRAVPVRLAGGGSRGFTYLGFSDWLAGVDRPPLFSASLGYDESGWNGGAVPTTGTIRFARYDNASLSVMARLLWLDRPVSISVGEDAIGDASFATTLNGTIAKQETSGGFMSLTLSDLSGNLSKPFAPDVFGGMGGIDGDLAAQGRAKRRSLGRVFNVEGRLLINADNIYEFGDPARPLKAFAKVRDKGRAAPSEYLTQVEWQGSVNDTLKALRAAIPTQGGGVVAPSIACVKWWTQPAGPLTADILGEVGSGYVETAPELAGVVIASAGMTCQNVAAARNIRPLVAGDHVDSASDTAANVLDRLLLGVSMTWIVRPTGDVVIREWSFESDGNARKWSEQGFQPVRETPDQGSPISWGVSADAVATLRSEQVSRRTVIRPTGTRTLGYQRNNRVHSAAEVSVAILATDLAYADGTTVEALKPAQAGADVTALSQVLIEVSRQIPLAADYQGNINPAIFPVATTPRVTKGGTDIRTLFTTSYSIVTSNLTATVNNTNGDAGKGTIMITALAANSGTIDLTVTTAGVSQPAIRITVTKNIAAPPTTGSATAKSANDTSFNLVSGTSFVAISDALQIALATGERLIGTAPLDYYVQGMTGVRTRTASAKWQYATSASGPWTDFGAAIAGSEATSGYQTGSNGPKKYAQYDDGEYVEPVPGHGDFNQTASGLAANTYFVQLVAALDAAGSNVTFEGTATIEAKP